jgi:hypothetical protein
MLGNSCPCAFPFRLRHFGLRTTHTCSQPKIRPTCKQAQFSRQNVSIYSRTWSMQDSSEHASGGEGHLV